MKALLLALVIALPAVARADADLDTLSNFSADQKTLAQQRLDGLAAAGLARASAIDRVQEWQAKGADAARVLDLLESLRLAAVDGRAALVEAGLTPAPALVESAASARLAGVDKAPLSRALRGAASVDEATGRCLALSTLASSGFAVPAAADVVALAAERGYSRTDFSSLVSSAQRLAREGVVPREVLLGQVGSALRRGARPAELYPAVVHAIGNAGAARPAPEAGYNRGVLRTGGF